MFSISGFPIRNFSMAIGSANDIGGGLQISEVVPSNDGSIIDESGEAADWIELRNTGTAPVSLDSFGLAQTTSPAPDDIMRFPEGMILEAGEYLIVWADGDLEQGRCTPRSGSRPRAKRSISSAPRRSEPRRLRGGSSGRR